MRKICTRQKRSQSGSDEPRTKRAPSAGAAVAGMAATDWSDVEIDAVFARLEAELGPKVGHLRMRAATHDPDEPGFVESFNARMDRGDFRVREGDDEERISLEDRANAAELRDRQHVRAAHAARLAVKASVLNAAAARHEQAEEAAEWLRAALARTPVGSESNRARSAQEYLEKEMRPEDLDLLFPTNDKGERINRYDVRRALGKKK